MGRIIIFIALTLGVLLTFSWICFLGWLLYRLF